MSCTTCPTVTLTLVLATKWFDLTESGEKRTEYREMKECWRKQLWDARDRITHVRFLRGYTSRAITFEVKSIDVGPCPIPGWSGTYYRIHW